tara:strand:- start:1794 stop:3431 length:1638 start_codon:yes stop_codon:yes gene_type:complete
MAYFFVYLLIIIINIVAVLAVLRVRRNRQNDPNVITDVKDSDLVYESEENDIQKKQSFGSRFIRNSGISLGFNKISVDEKEEIYDGDLLDIAIKKKVIKKKGNWYIYEKEKFAYGKDKAKFYLLENPTISNEISNRVFGVINVQKNKDIDLSENEISQELNLQKKNLENVRSVNMLSGEYEVELAEVYVKSNTLKKVIENTIGTEVLIRVDISEKFNPVLNPPEVFAAEVIGLLNEMDYMIAAVDNISKNSKYLGIEVDEKLLRERLNLLMSSRFAIVFTKKPVLRHSSLPQLNFQAKNNRPQRSLPKSISYRGGSKMVPYGVGLLIIGFLIVAYSISQTFFSMSVLDDEQNLLAVKYEQYDDTSIKELRTRNVNSLDQNVSLNDTGEFQESVLSLVSKTMSNENANAEYLPDVVGRLIIFPSKVDHYVVYGSSLENLEFGPGYYLSTALPGTGGNFAVAGHRTTYGAPFKNLDRLSPGDNIYFQTNTNQYTYTVSEVRIVDPSETYLLSSFGDDRITLTTCHPKFSARQRLVVIGLLTKVEVFG